MAWRVFNRAIALVLAVTNSGSADDIGIAEAFGTYNLETLEVFAESLPDGALQSYEYGRGYNAVHAAVSNKDNPESVRLAHEYGADINHQDDDGRTPLHHAIDANLIGAASILLEIGADTSIQNEAGLDVVAFCAKVLSGLPDHETCNLVRDKTSK